MASYDLGVNESKVAQVHWDYVDNSQMPATSITASVLSLMKGCGAKAQHPGVLAGVASFSAGIALHRMRRGHGKRTVTKECVDIVSHRPPLKVISKDDKAQRSWLPISLKAAGATCLMFAASRKVRKHWKMWKARKGIKLGLPAIKDAPRPKAKPAKLKPPLKSWTFWATSRERLAEKGCWARSIPSFQTKLESSCVEDDNGKVALPALPIMHFKRIQCFDEDSPFSWNGATRSPSLSDAEQIQEGDSPKSGSPDQSKDGQAVQQVGESPCVEQVPGSPPDPREMLKNPEEMGSFTPPVTVTSSPEKQAQGPEAAQPASAAANAFEKSADKQSHSPRSQPDAKVDKAGIPLWVQNSQRGVTPHPPVPHQTHQGSGATQSGNQLVLADAKGLLPKVGGQHPAKPPPAAAKGEKPSPHVHQAHAPKEACKHRIEYTDGPKMDRPPGPSGSSLEHGNKPSPRPPNGPCGGSRPQVPTSNRPLRPEASSGSTSLAVQDADDEYEIYSYTGSSRSASPGTPPAKSATAPKRSASPGRKVKPAATSTRPASPGKSAAPTRKKAAKPDSTLTRSASPGRANARSASTPARPPAPGRTPARSASTPARPASPGRTPAPSVAAQDSDNDLYSVYSYTSQSSNASREGHRKCGNEFLPDISVQVRAKDPERSHGKRARAAEQ